jgi:CheY-like chemotaxis protein
VRILICDDNADAAQAMSMLVAFERHETRVCHDGPACIARALLWRPHVVLVDIGMPGMDGYQVAAALRAELGRDTFLIAFSGYSAPEDVRAATDAGFDIHISKSADPQAVIQAVRAHAPH